MGLFDVLESAAGLGAGATPQSSQGPGLAGAAAAVIQMLQSQPGGVSGVLQRLEGSGLGQLASSWLGAGPNAPISPQQVHTALGAGAVGQVAQQLSVSPDTAASHIAQFLPLIIDHLSPAAQAPAGGGIAQLTSLLSRIQGGSQTVG